jgi:subtilisin family serine protease
MIAVAGLVGAGGARAVEEAVADSGDRNPITIYTGNAVTMAPDGFAEQLRQRARAQGQIRVIVGLRLAMQAEDTLSAAGALTQLRALQTIQSGLAARVLGAADAQSVDRFTFIPYMSMFVSADQLDRLLADPQVLSIQEDIPTPPLLAQSGPLVHAPEVWAKGVTGNGQVIAVLDTGVAKTHPMLAGKVVSEACYSTENGLYFRQSFCPGRVAATTAAGSGVNCPLSVDGCEHGTHVAGIAAGNSANLDGIASSAKLIAIQVFTRITNTTPNEPRAFDTDLIKALQRVYALRGSFKIAAVNMSLGGGKYAAECDTQFPALTTAITKLRDVGIATIVASGNDGGYGTIAKPACISTAIPVGNTRKDDLLYGGEGPNRKYGSNHSDLIRLLAPGTDIKSAVPGNKYELLTGTSMAAPHVAGAFGLLRQAKPAATVDELVEALRCSGKPINRIFVEGTGTGTGLFAIKPYRRRIDLLGAFYTLKNVPSFLRTWSFDKAAEGLDWAPVYGTWKVQSENFVPTISGVKGVATQVSTCHNNVQVIARVKREGTESSGQYIETGIVVRAEGSFNEGNTTGYAAVFESCAANSTGHCDDEATGPRGLALFYRINQQKASDGFPVRNTLCRKSRAINVSGYNTIKVVSNGARHSYYLNGALVCTVNDNTWPDGNVMLYGGPANLATYGLKFDSVSLQAVGSNPPAPVGAVQEVAGMDSVSTVSGR